MCCLLNMLLCVTYMFVHASKYVFTRCLYVFDVSVICAYMFCLYIHSYKTACKTHNATYKTVRNHT